MARRSTVTQVIRAMERAHRQAVREQERARKEAERERVRQAKADAKRAKEDYVQSRFDEVDELNEALQLEIDLLRDILAGGTSLQGPLSFDSLRKTYRAKKFNPESVAKKPHRPGRTPTSLTAPGFLSKLFGGQRRHEEELRQETARLDSEYKRLTQEYQKDLAAWEERVTLAKTSFEDAEGRRKADVEEHNAAIDEMEAAVANGDPESVAEYFSSVFEGVELPDSFPREYRMAYVPDSKQLVVEAGLPLVDVVPTVAEYSYVKTKDEIREKARRKTEIKEIYQQVISGTVLRLMAEIFAADESGNVQSLVINGTVDTTSPATGERVSPCIVTARITREEFDRLVLSQLDPVACLANLGTVSKRPEELVPVRPVVEFNMVDHRFVEESDVMSGLDKRTNIMDLNPYEFENLVTNLFGTMGLESKLTRSSRDGGVDAVAFDPRPVLGGKVVIQAKRWKNTVGVAAVRDLYGTMINEGASKGILVTTSGYGPDAFTFANDKPIELIDGRGLLYLLGENGIEAKIVMPEDPV